MKKMIIDISGTTKRDLERITDKLTDAFNDDCTSSVIIKDDISGFSDIILKQVPDTTEGGKTFALFLPAYHDFYEVCQRDYADHIAEIIDYLKWRQNIIANMERLFKENYHATPLNVLYTIQQHKRKAMEIEEEEERTNKVQFSIPIDWIK